MGVGSVYIFIESFIESNKEWGVLFLFYTTSGRDSNSVSGCLSFFERAPKVRITYAFVTVFCEGSGLVRRLKSKKVKNEVMCGCLFEFVGFGGGYKGVVRSV